MPNWLRAILAIAAGFVAWFAIAAAAYPLPESRAQPISVATNARADEQRVLPDGTPPAVQARR